MVTKTLKVDFDKLGETDDAYADTTLDGRLFTGITYEKDGPEGRLVSLSGYRDGKAYGATRMWYPSGSIAVERYYYGGGLHGPWREWFPDGRPLRDAYYEYGHVLRSKRWSEDGSVLEDERLQPGSSDFADLSKRREQWKNPILDIDLDTWEFVEKPIGWGRDASELPDASLLTARWPR